MSESNFDPTTFRPRTDNVLVRIEREQWLTDTPREERRIILPGTANRPEASEGLIGVVVSAGPGYRPDRRMKPHREREPGEQSPTIAGQFVATTVRPGDRVLLDTSLSGDALQDSAGNSYRLVREAEIAAVVES